MGRIKSAFRLWKRKDCGGIYHWCSPESPNWKSTGETVKELARQHVLGELNRRTLDTETVPLREFLRPYFTENCPHCTRFLAEGKSIGEGHVKHSRGLLDHHILTDPIADMVVGKIRRADILDLRQRLIDKKGPGVANKALTALRTCLREAYYREELSRDPCLGVGKINVPKPEVGTFTAAELAKLFPKEGLGPWKDRQDYACFLVAASVGMRMSEILALHWRDIDFEEGLIRVQHAWKFKAGKVGPPKWSKLRTAPLPDRTAQALRELRAESTHVLPDGLVFCYEDGSRLGETWWRDRFQRAMKEAKINVQARNLKPHAFRHSLNTLLRDRGAAAEKVRAALGWSDSGIQEVYTHWSAADFSEQATMIDKMFSGKKAQGI